MRMIYSKKLTVETIRLFEMGQNSKPTWIYKYFRLKSEKPLGITQNSLFRDFEKVFYFHQQIVVLCFQSENFIKNHEYKTSISIFSTELYGNKYSNQFLSNLDWNFRCTSRTEGELIDSTTECYLFYCMKLLMGLIPWKSTRKKHK